MSDIDLDDLHRLIDAIENGINELSRLNGTTVKMKEIPIICSVIMELWGKHRAAWRNSLRISPALLNRFTNMNGSVKRSEATSIANRIKSYLKSLDQPDDYEEFDETEETETLALPPPPTRTATVPLTIRAEQWVSVPRTSEMQNKITTLSSILESIIQQTGRSNLPDNEQALTPLERQQLIVILETALSLLRSPIVESGLLKKARDALTESAMSAANTGMQEGLGTLMGVAAHKVAEFIGSIVS